MTSEEIRELRKVYDSELRDAEQVYLEVQKTVWVKIYELQAKCPHENIGQASYSKWCNDCGQVWDTT